MQTEHQISVLVTCPTRVVQNKARQTIAEHLAEVPALSTATGGSSGSGVALFDAVAGSFCLHSCHIQVQISQSLRLSEAGHIECCCEGPSKQTALFLTRMCYSNYSSSLR